MAQASAKDRYYGLRLDLLVSATAVCAVRTIFVQFGGDSDDTAAMVVEGNGHRRGVVADTLVER